MYKWVKQSRKVIRRDEVKKPTHTLKGWRRTKRQNLSATLSPEVDCNLWSCFSLSDLTKLTLVSQRFKMKKIVVSSLCLGLFFLFVISRYLQSTSARSESYTDIFIKAPNEKNLLENSDETVRKSIPTLDQWNPKSEPESSSFWTDTRGRIEVIIYIY